MTARPILNWPDSALSQICAPVSAGTKADVAALVSDLFDSMYAGLGRGLAAPQIGVLKRVFVMDAGWKSGKRTPRACLDPSIVAVGPLASGEEACLSMPGIAVSVARASEVVLSYTDLQGHQRREHLVGAEAIIAQHEADHLDGKMHFDHLDATARTSILAQYEAMT